MKLRFSATNTLLQKGLALVGGVIVVGALFTFMSVMISGNGSFRSDDRSSTVMHFIRVKDVSQVQQRSRERPPEPEPPKQPPPPARPELASVTAPQSPEVRFDMPNLDVPMGVGDGPFFGGAMSAATSSAELLPLVRIEPQYPRQAAMAGVEGWVKARVDIEPDGSVSNITIVESSPSRIWDRSTERALLRWKFRPVEIDGRPVRIEGHEVTIDFKLNR